MAKAIREVYGTVLAELGNDAGIYGCAKAILTK